MKLGQYLEKEKLTYAAFGRLVGLPRVTIRQYALGQRTMIDSRNLKKIVIATGGKVTANDFYDVEPTASRARKRRAA